MKDEKFLVPLSFGQLAGFAALVLGTLIYNEIWIVPYEPLSKNTKRELEKRNNNGILDGIASGQEYAALSPAHYDNQRNMRNIDAKMNERGKLGNRLYDDDEDIHINEVNTHGSSKQ